MTGDELPRFRLTPLPDRAQLVVRGDDLIPEVLRADAERFLRRYPGWGRYGVSAFVAVDEAEIEALCETRLERFEAVVVFGRAALVALGVEVVPTFRRPHVTLAHADLDALVAGMLRCEHTTRDNPHHEPA